MARMCFSNVSCLYINGVAYGISRGARLMPAIIVEARRGARAARRAGGSSSYNRSAAARILLLKASARRLARAQWRCSPRGALGIIIVINVLRGALEICRRKARASRGRGRNQKENGVCMAWRTYCLQLNAAKSYIIICMSRRSAPGRRHPSTASLPTINMLGEAAAWSY